MTTRTNTATDGPAESAAAKAADEKIVPIQPEDTETEHRAPQSDAVQPAAAAEVGDKGEEPPKEPKEQRVRDRHSQKLTENSDARKRVAERFREMREADRQAREEKAPAAKQAPPAREEEVTPPKEVREPPRKEPVKAAKDEPAQDLPQKVILKVNGREEEVTLEEALSRARKYTADEEKIASRLDRSKAILHDAIRTVAGKPRGNGTTDPQPSSRPEPDPQPAPAADEPQDPPQARSEAPDPQPRKGLDKAKLKELTDRVQTGDTDEGAEALQELFNLAVDEARAKTASPEQVRTLVRAENVQARIDAENNAALGRFADQFPELAENSQRSRLLGNAARSALCDELARDLEDLGVSEAELRPIRYDDNKLALLRNTARAAGLKVRTPDEVLGAVGQTLVETFNIRPAQRQSQPETVKPAQRETADPALQERIDRKRAQAQQPRTAGVRAPAPQPPAPRTKEQFVRDLRVARGFPVTR